MKKIATLLLIAMAGATVWAGPVDRSQAQRAAQVWMRAQPQGTALREKQIRAMDRIARGDDRTLGYVTHLEQGGFIVLSGDDELEPVIAFSEDGWFEPTPGNPLFEIVCEDLTGRSRRLQRGADPPADPQEQGRSRQRRTTGPRQRWSELSQTEAASDDAERRLSGGQGDLLDNYLFLFDVRVSPLMQSKWSQQRAAYGYCYNYYTPSHHPAGCVATAIAQMMRFHEYPTAPLGDKTNVILLEGWEGAVEHLRGGDGQGGAYDWSLMPLVPEEGLVEAQRQAIGRICFDAGIAVGMSYTAEASSASSDDIADAFLSYFEYENVVDSGHRADGFELRELLAMVNTNLDAGCPVLLSVRSSADGHVVVADGYGYVGSSLYHHLNLGWGGQENAWYNLPNVRNNAYDYGLVNRVHYNLFPAGQGQILSGRVVDGEGNLLEGVAVSVVPAVGQPYSVTTDRKGIYVVAHLPAGTYAISAEKDGYVSATTTVAVSESAPDACGNVWGADLCLYRESTTAVYGGGTGTAEDPYLISTAAHLLAMRSRVEDYDKHFLLTEDIDLGGQTFSKAVIAWDPDLDTTFTGTRFAGSFDGGSHTIRNVTLHTANLDAHYLGLFGEISETAVIENLILEDVSITGGAGSRYVGGIVGKNGGAVRRCGVTGRVYGGPTTSETIGGVSGWNLGPVEYCFVDAEVFGRQHVGGIVGWSAGPVRYCCAAGKVRTFDTPGDATNIGGIAGIIFNEVRHCYSRTELGGFSVWNDWAGAFCGILWDGSVIGCVNDRQTSGILNSPVGYNQGGSISATDQKTTAEMKQQATYTQRGWDFAATWRMSASDSPFAGYPVHRWLPEATRTLVGIRLDLPAEMVEGQSAVAFCWAEYDDGTSENVTTKADVRIQRRGEPLLAAASGESTQAEGPLPAITDSTYDSQVVDFGEIDKILEGVPLNISQVTQAIGSAGCILFISSVPEDTEVDISAIYEGAEVVRPVLVLNQSMQFSGGTGTQQDPYLIGSVRELLAIDDYSWYADDHYRLIADLDLSDCYFTTAVLFADEEVAIGFQGTAFTGTFDGNGHCISNFLIAATDTTDAYMGLFGRIAEQGRVHDLWLDGFAILCPQARWIGGLCGYSSGTVYGCQAAGLIYQGDSSSGAGVLCGGNDGTIRDCCALGYVQVEETLGGLCGYNGGSIERCYTASVVDGQVDAAPLCGSNEGAVSACFWDATVAGVQNALVGTPLTNEQMQTAAPFQTAGWDFPDGGPDVALWHMPWQTPGYPEPWWRKDIPGDLAGEYGVEAADLAALAVLWGATDSDPGWDPAYDLNSTGASAGVVDLADLLLLAANWLAGG